MNVFHDPISLTKAHHLRALTCWASPATPIQARRGAATVPVTTWTGSRHAPQPVFSEADGSFPCEPSSRPRSSAGLSWRGWDRRIAFTRDCSTNGRIAVIDRPTISPMPPVAAAVGLPWDLPIDDPVSALAEARRLLGDTFVVDSGEDRYLFTFSPSGVAAFYALPEDRASKGVADWRMLRRKLPDEIFVGRRTLPHQLFARDNVATYLAQAQRALEATVDEVGGAGEVDVFDLTRRLGHRVGMASWGGPGSASGQRFDRLAEAFDALDGSDSFVHPDAMMAVGAAGKATERDAPAVVTEEVGQI